MNPEELVKSFPGCPPLGEGVSGSAFFIPEELEKLNTAGAQMARRDFPDLFPPGQLGLGKHTMAHLRHSMLHDSFQVNATNPLIFVGK